MHQLLAQSERDKSMGYAIRNENRGNGDGSDFRPVRICFVGVVEASQKIQDSIFGLDGVIAESAAIYTAQVEILQSVAHEIPAHKTEYPGIDVVIVTNSCRDQIGHRAGRGQIILGIN